MMSGIAGDNGTRYLEVQKGRPHANHADLINGAIDGADFVWNGRTVRVMRDLESGGHPALAGFESICCAGRIEGDYFFFHSGHYHPKREHALHFFCDLIDNTCNGLMGIPRDTEVDRLSKVVLRLYRDGSEIDTYDTTLAREIGPRGIVPVIPHPHRATSSAIPIGGKYTPPIYTPPPLPSPVQGGATPHGRHLMTYKINQVPNWVPDTARSDCANCRKDFSLFRRRHHCRQCGNLFCDDCSSRTKNLTHPAHRDANDTDSGPFRVCDNCY
jgi:hypothetical protein